MWRLGRTSRRAGALALIAAALMVAGSQGASATADAVSGLADAVRATVRVPSDADGSGVVLGIIDSGIDSTHPCFAGPAIDDADRRGELDYATQRVVLARSYASGGEQPIYPGGPVLGTAPSAAPSSDHGTHVAGIAACAMGARGWLGRTPVEMAGVAPEVLLASYNVFPAPAVEGIGPSDDLVAHAVDDAVADGVDVISLSLSLPSAAATERAIARAWRAGVVVVAAAGNDGPAQGSIAAPARSPEAIAVGSVETGWTWEALVTVAAQGFLGHVAEGIDVVAGVEGWAAPQLVGGGSELSDGCEAGDLDDVSGGIAVVARGRCTFSRKMANAVRAKAAGLIIVSLDDQDVEPLHVGGPTLPAMVVHPDAGRALIAAAGTLVRMSPRAARLSGAAGVVSSWSSRGPAADGRVKPDVVAPGGGVVSAATVEACDGGRECALLLSGTSMAAPVVAGVVALVREAHPDWSAAAVRSAVVHTAIRLPDGDAMQQGSGLVDATAAVAARIAVDSLSMVLPRGSRGLVEVQALTSVQEPVSVSVERADRAAPASIDVDPRGFTVSRGSPVDVVVSIGPDAATGVYRLVLSGAGPTVRVPVAVLG